MNPSSIDQDALVTLFAESSKRQGEVLRQAVADATLRALQGRELTLASVRKAVRSVTAAASLGAARNPAPAADVEALLAKALEGIDSALLQAVEANRKALAQFVSQGVDLAEKPMQQALADVEKMEDAFFDAVAKASRSAGPLEASWNQALGALRMHGSQTGAGATRTVDDLLAQAQASLRDGRARGVRAAQAMLDSYTALVSGVLIGMSQGLQGGTAKAPAPGLADPAGAPAAAAPAARPRRRRDSA